MLTLIEDINKTKPTYNIVGFFDDGHEEGKMINGYPVLGKTEELDHWQDYAVFIPSYNNSSEVLIEEGVYCGTGV